MQVQVGHRSTEMIFDAAQSIPHPSSANSSAARTTKSSTVFHAPNLANVWLSYINETLRLEGSNFSRDHPAMICHAGIALAIVFLGAIIKKFCATLALGEPRLPHHILGMLDLGN